MILALLRRLFPGGTTSVSSAPQPIGAPSSPTAPQPSAPPASAASNWPAAPHTFEDTLTETLTVLA